MERTNLTQSNNNTGDKNNEAENFNFLPDIFIINIFKKFDLKQRLRLACVCKKWNVISKDGSLWSKIDLRKYRDTISLKQLKNLTRVYGCESSKELIIVGNYSPDDNSYKRLNIQNLYINKTNQNTKFEELPSEPVHLIFLDKEYLHDCLRIKCPNMTDISLEYLDLSCVNFNMIKEFNNLKSLSLKWCKLGQKWFKPDDDSNRSCIENLYLIRLETLQKYDIDDLCSQTKSLKVLSIDQSSSTLDDESVDLIINTQTNLEQFDLTNTLITDHAISLICKSAKNLIRLNISMSSKITNTSLESIVDNLKNLKYLYLTSCFGISNINLLQNFKSLSYLNINNTSIDKEKIREQLVPMLQGCEIEFGHEKMLNRKLMWTINGSRNCVCSF